MQRRLKIVLRTVIAGLLALEAAWVEAQPAEQPYPSKLIKVLVGVPPGGSTDALTRIFAEWLRESMGQPTIVENRPGANTTVAAVAAAHSAPDGYTLLVATDAFLVMPLLTKAEIARMVASPKIKQNGATVSQRVDHPRGHSKRGGVTWQKLAQKWNEGLPECDVDRMLAVAQRLEDLDDVHELVDAFRVVR